MEKAIDLNELSVEDEILKLPETAEIHGRGNVEIRDVSKLDRTAVFIFNTADIDEYDSVISPRGLDVETYFRKTGGAVRRGHGANSEIGKSLWEKQNNDKTQWMSKVKFADTERGNETMALAIDEDIVKFASVGIARKGVVEMFGEKARSAYEKDYADVGLKATSRMNWYIQRSQMLHYGLLSDPGNINAKLLRSVKGMSEDTQSWLYSAFLREQFPAVLLKLEALERSAELLKQTDLKLQELTNKITELETRRDGEKPLAQKQPEEKIIRISPEEHAKFLEFKVRRAVQEQIDRKKGKINHGR